MSQRRWPNPAPPSRLRFEAREPLRSSCPNRFIGRVRIVAALVACSFSSLRLCLFVVRLAAVKSYEFKNSGGFKIYEVPRVGARGGGSRHHWHYRSFTT